MKLKRCKSINEAENTINKGYRLKYVDQIRKQIENDVISADYKFKVNSDTQFLILPDFGYLAAVDIELAGTDKFNVNISDIHGHNDSPLVADISSTNSVDLLNSIEKIGSSIVEYLGKFTPDKLKEAYLTEGPLGNLFTKAFSKVKTGLDNFISDAGDAIQSGQGMSLKDKTAIYKANKDDRKNSEDLLSGIGQRFGQALQTAVKGISSNSQASVTLDISGKIARIAVASPFVVAVNWGIDPRGERGTKLIVSSISTPFGTWQMPADKLDESLNLALSKIGKMLGINFKNIPELKEPEEEESDSKPEAEKEEESDTEEKSETDKADNQQNNQQSDQQSDSTKNTENSQSEAGSKLKQDPIANKILTGVSSNVLKALESLTTLKLRKRSLNESSRGAHGDIPYQKYQNAVAAASNNEIPQIVKLFVYKELGLQDSRLNSRILNDLVQSVADNGINPQFNNDIAAFLRYYDINKQLPPAWFFDVVEDIDIGGDVDVFVDSPSIDDVIKGRSNPIYSKSFWDVADPSELVKRYRLLSNQQLQQKSLAQQINIQKQLAPEGQNTPLKDLFGKEFKDSSWTENNWQDLKKLILTDGTRFRSAKQISACINALKKTKAPSKNKSQADDTDEEEIDTETEVTEEEPEETSKLSQEDIKDTLDKMINDKRTVKKELAELIKKSTIFDNIEDGKLEQLVNLLQTLNRD